MLNRLFTQLVLPKGFKDISAEEIRTFLIAWQDKLLFECKPRRDARYGLKNNFFYLRDDSARSAVVINCMIDGLSGWRAARAVLYSFYKGRKNSNEVSLLRKC